MLSLSRLRRVVPPIALALLACVVVAGCGSGSSSSSATTATGPLPKGGTLRVGWVGGINTDVVDPQAITSSWVYVIDVNVFEALYARDVDFKLQPELAVKATPSDGNRTWTVVLRRGVTFSDGRPFGAADVIFSIDRIKDPKTAGTASAALSEVASVQKVDDHKVVFHLSRPDAFLPDTLSSLGAAIVPVGFDPAKPIGTGAFTLQGFTPGRSATLAANPHYWRPSQPHLSRIDYQNYPESTALIDAFTTSQLDLALAIQTAQVKVASTRPDSNIVTSENGGFVAFTMNTSVAPFNDQRVREALALIVDRPQMIDQVFGGRAALGNDITSPDDACYASDIPQRTQDVARARQLLAAAGQSNLKITYVASDVTPGAVSMGEVLKQQAAAAGVQVTIKTLDPTSWFTGVNKWPFTFTYWPQLGIANQIAAAFLPTSPGNDAHFSPPSFVKAFNEMEAMTDPAKRCAALKGLQQQLHDGVPWIVWGFPSIFDAAAGNVLGTMPDKTGYGTNAWRFRDLAIEH